MVRAARVSLVRARILLVSLVREMLGISLQPSLCDHANSGLVAILSHNTQSDVKSQFNNNESGFGPLLCINWANRTPWGWWDDIALQPHDSKLKPWRSEAEHATSRSRRHQAQETNQWTQNIYITFIQCCPNVEDVGPTLCKFYTHVLCLLANRSS